MASSNSILMIRATCQFGFEIIAMVRSSMQTAKQRLLSLIVGRRGLPRDAAMILMRLRSKRRFSQLQHSYRFIRTLQSPHHVIADERTGVYRISSKAFGPSKEDGALSGDLEEVLAADGLPSTAMYPPAKGACA